MAWFLSGDPHCVVGDVFDGARGWELALRPFNFALAAIGWIPGVFCDVGSDDVGDDVANTGAYTSNI